jgi:chromosome partitioning protein
LADRAYRVLLIDLDDQQNTTRAISTIVINDNDTANGKTIEDLLLNEETTLQEVTVKTEWDNVWILPASNNLSGVVKHLDQEVGGHLILKEKLSGDNIFDYVIIDTAPTLSILVINALCASDFMFIPLDSRSFSMQGLKQTLTAFKKINTRLNPDLKLLGIAFVNHDKRNVLANEIIEKVSEAYSKELFLSVIGINIKIQEAQVKKQSILIYSPADRGAEQYKELGNEILQRIASVYLQGA